MQMNRWRSNEIA